MKPLFFKLHRWIALAFALPLLAVLASGLVLSFEPCLVARAIVPASVDAAKLVALLDAADPKGAARAISVRSYDGSVSIGGRGGGTLVDLATGARLDGPSTTSAALSFARRLHETLLFDAAWLVVASTAAMLVLVILGVLMGWPHLANNVSSWHKAAGWGMLPLAILSPMTGLMLSAGITLAPPAPEPGPAPASLRAAIVVAGRDHDLSALVWLRTQGSRWLARFAEDGEFRVYEITADAAVATPRNWPRLWHEGNFAGVWSVGMNAVLSGALLSLLATGVWLWARRQFRKRSGRAKRRLAIS